MHHPPWGGPGPGGGQAQQVQGSYYPQRIIVLPVPSGWNGQEELARSFFPPPFGNALYYPGALSQHNHWGGGHTDHWGY